ncbi:putative quinol monooxygenase [Silvibacterium sp.]|uniref:putative quinol monooxygenase n=1 Tax=Silvibacterium sp. TaxID=1964179 RepID=UPI0039E6BF43
MKTGLLALTIVALGSFSSLHAQNAAPDTGPITIVDHVDIKPDAYLPGAEEKAAALFRAEEAASRKDAGIVSYEIYQQLDATNHFTFVETWRSLRDYQRHEGSDHTVAFRKQIEPVLGGPFDARLHKAWK